MPGSLDDLIALQGSEKDPTTGNTWLDSVLAPILMGAKHTAGQLYTDASDPMHMDVLSRLIQALSPFVRVPDTRIKDMGTDPKDSQQNLLQLIQKLFAR